MTVVVVVSASSALSTVLVLVVEDVVERYALIYLKSNDYIFIFTHFRVNIRQNFARKSVKSQIFTDFYRILFFLPVWTTNGLGLIMRPKSSKMRLSFYWTVFTAVDKIQNFI
jgi:hypothetical protein